MQDAHKQIIQAIIQKAETVCPGSLALIGVYGSVATGDIHEKSDLDLLILVRDDRGRQLAEGFILDNPGIGYDLYCTTWEMLEADAQCNHAHLSKLLDAHLVYCADQATVQRLEQLRTNAATLLASDTRFEKAQAALRSAKIMYADCFLTDSLSQIRTGAGTVIHFLLDALMLHHGSYFRKGLKRTFEELNALHLSFCLEDKVMAIICAETADTIRANLTDLIQAVQSHLHRPSEKAEPCADNLAGTYEEMFSNWRNKMPEAAVRGDLFSSFMNMVSLQHMLRDISESVHVQALEIMDRFDPHDLQQNADTFDAVLAQYLDICQIRPNRYADVGHFLTAYLEV